MTLFTMVLPGDFLVRIWDLMLVEGIKVLYQVVLAVLNEIEPDLLQKDLGGIVEIFTNLKIYVIDPEEFVKKILYFKIKKSVLLKLENEYINTFVITVSPIKEKNNQKLPPLKQSPIKINNAYRKSPKTTLTTTLSSNYSPSHKPTTVPTLPNINRKLLKKKSFGITTRSCDISIVNL